MITFHQENWRNYYYDREREALWQEHYNEFWEVHQGRMSMDPDRTFYEGLDRQGMLEVIIARKLGRMVGYCLMVIKRHNHYGALCAFEDSYFLTASERRGGAGFRLISKSVEVARHRGAVRGYWMTKALEGENAPPSVDRIFEKLGMTRMDTVWALWLQERST